MFLFFISCFNFRLSSWCPVRAIAGVTVAVATRRPVRAIAGVAAESKFSCFYVPQLSPSACFSIPIARRPRFWIQTFLDLYFPLMNFELTEKGRDIPGDPFVSSMRAQITHTSQTRMWSERCSQSFLGVSASSTLRHSAVQLHKSMHSTILESIPWGSECVCGPMGLHKSMYSTFLESDPGGALQVKVDVNVLPVSGIRPPGFRVSPWAHGAPQAFQNSATFPLFYTDT